MPDSSPLSWVGKPAPDFALLDQHGKTHSLTDYKGKYVVLYWYPRDSTPGCTKEACGFRDHTREFAKLNAVVLGASILNTASKAKFAKKHNLTFPLLADEDHKIAEAYGVWKKKSMVGISFLGIARETFLIGPDGVVLKHWDKAKGSEDHAPEVLAVLKDIQSN